MCIDDTRDSDADVPDSFLTVQGTRLRGGAYLGNPAEARRLFEAAEQLGLSPRDSFAAANIALEWGDAEKAITLLGTALREPTVVTRAFLRISPSWDKLHGVTNPVIRNAYLFRESYKSCSSCLHFAGTSD